LANFDIGVLGARAKTQAESLRRQFYPVTSIFGMVGALVVPIFAAHHLFAPGYAVIRPISIADRRFRQTE
jgi:hypothetical protein